MWRSITAARAETSGAPTRRKSRAGERRGRKRLSALTALTLAVGLVPTAAMVGTPAHAAPVGQGFNVNADDLRFILKQIKISEQHAANFDPQDPCAGLVGPGPNQIPEGGNTRELPWGLRTVDGTCNNLLPGKSTYGAADMVFPRLTTAEFRDAEASPFGPPGGPATSYTQTKGDVFDSEPRTISNLIVDQTKTNPAALAAAGVEDASTVQPGRSLSIPNVAPDVGLSAPFNSVFTFFGQFFDHGLDLVTKKGGTVYMPLKPDDPLYVEGSHTNFMVLTRSLNQPGPDGVVGDNRNTAVDESADDVKEATNTTATFVDQSQTYGSLASQQVFLREYANNAAGDPVSTGHLLEGPDGGMATWAAVKAQARDLLGIELTDEDVLSIPQLETDPYGRFERGPNGYPLITLAAGGTREGNPAAPVSTTGALPTGHAFLDDIAHNAVPGMADHDHAPHTPMVRLTADLDEGITGAEGRQTPGTYDDEMLDAHFVAGDGRVNENIGLTAVHQIFHAEHNRLAGAADVDGTLKHVLVTEDPTMVSEWQLPDGSWNGERIFQAARFVTEMEYQHLAFEEFVRKVQPMVNAFGEGGTGYNTSIDPALSAEFAHAVYRFGHSMLTENVVRKNADGSRSDVSLIQAFLNPPQYMAGYASPEAAAGSIFRGMSRQVGNEIDEFVTGALRSNLLGLPLDLAAINMARAREAGVPPLNSVRRQFFAESNNSALKPYESWTDFGFSLKHRESLVNFVAAYGTHPTILTDAGVDGTLGTSDDGPPTLASRRAAAQLLVDPPADALPTEIPADAGDFMSASGTWQGRETGINRVDLWVGGLAEKQMVFGGLLGSTFNYVFENQMEDLQFGDRFYYLSRTAGLNLLTQLEGNSFAELIMRNTDVQGLPADVFSRPDYIFNVGNLGDTGAITDDLSTEEYNEGDRTTEPGADLHRMPNGTIRYTGPAHVVFNGTARGDLVRSSEGDDTVRGNDGDDRVEGGDGVDNLIGGLGDDILTDLFGDDTIKGGDGDDAISSGQGFGGDLNQGGRGKDLIVNGNDLTEAFAGPGDDFVLGGDDIDTVFGDDGDDWIEGGAGPFNLLQGDAGNPFANDPNGGHDVLDGDGGEQDFDAEGGDDVMLMGPGIQRAEGMLGFDWTTHKGDPQPADSDMAFTGLLPPTVGTLRDRFDLVEGLSGWKHDDVLRGDNGIPGELEGLTTPEEHKLTEAGIDRIQGLAALLPAGATSYGNGNIILGGGGSDTMEGRGGDDIIHGDAWLNVQLRVPNLSTTVNLTDTILVDGLKSTALVEEGVDKTVEQLVFAGRMDPGDISIVRRVQHAAPGADIDTVVYSGSKAEYDVTENANGVKTVEQIVTPPAPGTPDDDGVPEDEGVEADAPVNDGTDRLIGVEKLVFADSVAPGTPTVGAVTGANRSATVTWSAPTVGAVTGYQVRVVNAATGLQVGNLRPAGAGAVSLLVTGLTNGTAYQFEVRAGNDAGVSAFSAPSDPVTPAATVPGAPTLGAAEAGNQQATVHWTAPTATGGEPILRYEVEVTDVDHRLIGGVRRVDAPADQLTVTGLANGTQYWFQVFAVNSVGRSEAVGEAIATPATFSQAPRIGVASARRAAAVVRWLAPTDSGGAGISEYRIRVVNGAGRQVGPLRSANAGASSLRVGALRDGGRYRFQVAAVNEIGVSRFSGLSNQVVPGTRPRRPVIGLATAGRAGGLITATAHWSEPRVVPVPRLTGYVVTALRMESTARDAAVLREFRSPVLRPTREQRRFVLPRGLYRFEVVAWNSRGPSNPSTRSRVVRAR